MAASLVGVRFWDFRAFEDSGWIELRPVNFLVGRNSSGKSSILRFFPLLRQSVETATSSPFLWNGDLVDFGDFRTVHRSKSEGGVLRLGFRFLLRADSRYRRNSWRVRRFGHLLNDEIVELELSLAEGEGGRSELQEVSVSMLNHLISITLSSSRVEDVAMDGTSVPGVRRRLANGYFLPQWQLAYESATLFPAHRAGADHLADLAFMSPQPFEEGDDRLAQLVSRILGVDQDSESVANLSIGVGKGVDIIKGLLEQDAAPRAANLRENVHRDLESASLLRFLPRILIEADKAIAEFALGVGYLGPLRAVADRYYRKRELAVEEIDFRGENLLTWLGSLETEEMSAFGDWVKRVLGFQPIATERDAHLSLELIDEDGARRNLADTGFGLSQALPVLAAIWTKGLNGQRESQLLAIEQPELHLHPHLQAAVGEAIGLTLSERRFGTIEESHMPWKSASLFVETHSEALLNGVGRAVRDDPSLADGVQVLIVESGIAGGPSSVHAVEFDESGRLLDWPYGFFSSR